MPKLTLPTFLTLPGATSLDPNSFVLLTFNDGNRFTDTDNINKYGKITDLA